MIGTGEGGAIVVFLFISNPCRGSTGKAEDFPPFKLRGKPTTESLVHVLKSKRRTLGGGNSSLKARCGGIGSLCALVSPHLHWIHEAGRFHLSATRRIPTISLKPAKRSHGESRAVRVYLLLSRLCNIRSCSSAVRS